MNAESAGSVDDIYNPGLYSMTDPKEKDKAGRGNKTAVHGCHITLDDGSEISLRYGLLTGHPEMNKEHTVIEIPVQGRIKLRGEWKPNADYLVRVKGRNLDAIFDQLNQDKRLSMHRSSGTEEKEPHIDSISVTELED